ncbi:Mediator of RNA polymerase II transcription subunit like [Actinidia chinensis var. chinensis]|uniref:Mediator of RNA polymerase II transcription subunit like n=1 Tax=Actinidia chinensis var. chinensis TaxID=1590841 RepID=A0A2R6Q662_ACTCC|nr:Mediator of RNA polymerase II transcription subunit like [Actinidia chinensis var. chinensis]
MALRFHLLHPKITPQPITFQPHRFPTRPQNASCTRSTNNPNLASDLAIEVEKKKIHTHLAQRVEAMRKSRELLFTELCNYLQLKPEELKNKLGKMNEEEKWVLVRGFVSEWSVDFHPLSARSVKELVEEHLVEL